MAYYDGEIIKQILGKKLNEFEELNVPISEVAIKIGQAIKDTPTADVVKVETVRAWLYEMAFNSVGCVVNGDFSDACEEIISRLDGLRNFARDKGDE